MGRALQRLSREKWAAEASPSCRGKSCRNPGLYPGKPEASAHLTDIPWKVVLAAMAGSGAQGERERREKKKLYAGDSLEAEDHVRPTDPY